ncbi:hypothetical protein QCN29_24680 [Streptomyces sp. HNM0663]|uniref:Uncharacterized protein n=1 Tax=Streptomyces chengmaiensis TaxID=3040919 RepID=A0ABT6HT64_9ACTN|nr:hypothetical protein [Streptomyces chengmaiensis]MDH2391916.1 hypothetical protein [Streptomyces chengmaiensis]
MSEATALPLVVVFGIITVLLVRARDVRAWEAVCIGLFGLYLGQTPVIFTVDGLMNWIFNGFSNG